MKKIEYENVLHILSDIMQTNSNYKNIFEQLDKEEFLFVREGFDYWYYAFKDINNIKTNNDLKLFLEKHFCTRHDFLISNFVIISHVKVCTLNALRNKWYEINNIDYVNKDEKLKIFDQFIQKITKKKLLF